ncbi:unnamed protein product, partial [marine sediment metagenome]
MVNKSIWDRTVEVEENAYYWHGKPMLYEPIIEPDLNNYTV